MIRKFLTPMLLLTSFCVADGSNDLSENKMQPSKDISRPACAPWYENDIFLEADFIYWRAKQDGNLYASTGTAITVPGTTDPNTNATAAAVSKQGKVYGMDYGFKPGFKVGAGINLAHSKWDLFAEYTHLYSKAHGSVSSNNINAGILPLFSYTPHNSVLSEASFFASSGSTSYVSSASAHSSLHFNDMHLELGRTLDLFSSISVRPHFGLQGTWQKQFFSALYKVSEIGSPTTKIGNNLVKFSQSSWGVGLRTGLDTVWKCCNHLELFANTALSALWQGFSANGKSYDTNLTYSDVLIANQVNNSHSISPILQIEAGLQSDWCFYNKYRFLVQAGWEEQVWFFQNQHSTVIPDNSLTLQGLTLKFRFDF